MDGRSALINDVDSNLSTFTDVPEFDAVNSEQVVAATQTLTLSNEDDPDDDLFSVLDSEGHTPESDDQTVPLTRLGEVWAGIRNALGDLMHEVATMTLIAARTLWRGVTWFARNVLRRIGFTGINVLGYFFDKILFGSPLIRPLLHDGLIKSEIPDMWRDFVHENAGWDIYEKMHPVLNNLFGLLGAGIGVLNFFNHLTTSIVRNIFNGYHFLGEYGVFGERKTISDKRNLPVKVIFGFLTAPIVLVPVFIANTVDALFTFTKNFFMSFGYNLKRTFNLLGTNGVMGQRLTAEDKRGLPAQVIYGILSAPVVLIPALICNIIDITSAFMKNFLQSFGGNLSRTYNLLGKNGVMGSRQTVKDERGMPAQVIYGILSAPFVLLPALATNFVDAMLAITKNIFISFVCNVRRTFNLLGTNGVMGPRRTAFDGRGMPAQIIYGVLSAPLVFVASLLPNLIDASLAFNKNLIKSVHYNVARFLNLIADKLTILPNIKIRHTNIDDTRGMPAQVIYGILSVPLVIVNLTVFVVPLVFTTNFFMSFYYNVKRTFNLLGENGVMGPRHTVEDKRWLPVQIITGIWSAPLVFVASFVTNLIDGVIAFSKNFFMSFGYNVNRTFNLLGKNGVMGERHTSLDTRGMPTKIAYGILSAPFVFMTSLITNLVDGILAFSKNFALSFLYNVKRSFNLLGENGEMGKRLSADDNRGMPTQIIYGILSAPFVFIPSFITNLIDAGLAFTKNFGLSFVYNVKRTFNMLGKNGVMGERLSADDKRGLTAQIIYGSLSAPFVFIPTFITNFLDAGFAFAKNFGLSFCYNVKRTFNLLGEYGVMGLRLSADDKRGMPAKIIYGIISAPFVFATSFVTNLVDGVLSLTKNFGLSLVNNVKRTFNLLGTNGVMGPRLDVPDARSMPTQVFYGILSSPFVFVTSLATNLVDGMLAFAKNFFLSFGYNTKRTFNLLGEHGVLGPRCTVNDTRDKPTKIFFGVISAPLVFIPTFFTNVFDAIVPVIKNTWLSTKLNIKRTFNLLGSNGVMGPRLAVNDTRGMPAQIICGILSIPFVILPLLITNTVDIILAFGKNFFLSYGYNVKRTFNLLGENGVMGKRRSADDKRGMPAQIIYGILSAPFVFITSAVSNLVDGLLAFTKNLFLSIGCNVQRTFNLLGKNGVMGSRQSADDKRGMPAQVIYGILSAPFVLIPTSITNLIDAGLAFTKNLALSFIYNVKRTFNLLGENGVMGKRLSADDKRGMSAQVIYGILSVPFVLIPTVITNLIDGGLVFAKNFFLSFGYNVKRTFNLLGENGVMGKRHSADDKRGLPAQIAYGICSAPFVFATTLLTNFVDAGLAFAKNFFLSLGYNVKRTFNLLGENGVMGERRTAEDKRGLPAQIVYGISSAPIVFATSLITNVVDALCSFSKNFALSIGRNLRSVFNLPGEHGIMGPRIPYQDNRSKPARIVYGILTAPIVGIAALFTNIVAGVCSVGKNYKKSLLKPLLIIGGVAAFVGFAIPVFIVRNTAMGLYNSLIRPFVACARNQPILPGKMLRGALNFLTLGVFEAGKKIFKAATGYTNRFGFPGQYRHAQQEDGQLSNFNYFKAAQAKFREIIDIAAHGGSPGDWQRKLRSVVRGIYGFRHSSEKIAKALHTAYLDYTKHLKSNKVLEINDAYSMNRFFQSPQFNTAKAAYKLSKGEEAVMDNVCARLCPA